MRHFFALAMVLAVSACSDDSSSTTPDSPVALPDAHATAADATPGTSPDAHSAIADAAPAAADAAPLPDAAATFSLTIHDYLSWCDVTANGAFFSDSQSPNVVSMSFPQHSVVNLMATPNGTFVWGYWTGTDHDTLQSTTLTLNADTTISVCCPISGMSCPASF